QRRAARYSMGLFTVIRMTLSRFLSNPTSPSPTLLKELPAPAPTTLGESRLLAGVARQPVPTAAKSMAAVLAASVFSCGTPSQEARAPEAEPRSHDDYDSTAHIGATAEVGALPEEDTAYAFKESFGAIQDCFIAGVRRVDYLGGEISF